MNKRDSKKHSLVVAALVSGLILAVIMSASVFAIDINRVRLIDDEGVHDVYTSYTDSEKIIAEQKKLLHPLDTITYAGYNDNGEFEIAVEKAPSVTIRDEDVKLYCCAAKGETVEELLGRENIDVSVYDYVFPALGERITDDTMIKIIRAFPLFIKADGVRREVMAAELTVGELLEREGIKLGEFDELSISAEMPVHRGMEISIDRIEYRGREISHKIPYETVYEESTLYAIGTETVIRKGSDGAVEEIYSDKYINGEFVSTRLSGTNKRAAVSEIVAVGTAKCEPISKKVGNFRLVDGVPTEYDYVVSGKCTAYTAREGCGTYSGRLIEVGTVAVNPDVIPFGSELYIVSKDGTHCYGYAIAADTGDLTEVVADCYMGLTSMHYRDACQWGAQFCDVYVLKTGDNSVSWR